MIIQSCPQLFALALGKPLDQGMESCFYCGASCNQQRSTKRFVADTFSNWGEAAYPQSKFVCAGCEECLNEQRDLGREKLQKTRMWSWLITDRSAAPLNKSHIDRIRQACLSPPAAPWALAIAVSGQKHVLFRTPVNRCDEPPFSVQLETETVSYTPEQMTDRLTIAKRIAAICGKPSLSAQLTVGHAIRLYEVYGDESLADAWNQLSGEPLSRLAAFLCPPKETCHAELFAAAGRSA